MFIKKYDSININEIKNINKTSIIDVRTKEEFQQQNIKGSKNIELQILLNNPEKYLAKDKKYYMMCASGMRSKQACNILYKLGYNVTNLKGGIMSYKK